MEIFLLVFGLLIGGGGIHFWQERKRAKLEQEYALVPRNSLKEYLEISTGSGALMCPHCNGFLKETVEAALLISIMHPDQAEIKVYRHYDSMHPKAEPAGFDAMYLYQNFVFPFVVPRATQLEIKDWVLASKIGKSNVEWLNDHTMRVWDPIANFRTGEAADYSEERRYLDHERMTAGLQRILRIADLRLYDPKKEDIFLPTPTVIAEQSTQK